jgi:hypothetical protein
MRLSAMLLTFGLLLLCAPALAQELAIFPDTEYTSGKAGFPEKIKGTLVIKHDGVSLQDKKGKTIFALPVATLVGASSSVETDPGSVGKRLALGVFASSREEFLTIKTETDSGAEAVVFKCKKKTSEDMAAKVEFLRKKNAQPKPPV